MIFLRQSAHTYDTQLLCKLLHGSTFYYTFVACMQDSIQALTNDVSLMECYFDVLTDVLGNLTYDVVHNKTSIWSHVRQLVYKAYNSSSVMQDMRRLGLNFPLH